MSIIYHAILTEYLIVYKRVGGDITSMLEGVTNIVIKYI
ncbi:hypothetical protein QE396_004669 [Enterobacter sp. SORGH_AS 287]|jgi:hypothetical protein|nr:hypothetical protein [Enterobacter sp. SORGH_AS_0287]